MTRGGCVQWVCGGLLLGLAAAVGGCVTDPTPPDAPARCEGEPLRLTAISAASEHACGLDGEGTVWCWGANAMGQLGRGTLGGPVPEPRPVLRPGSCRR